MITQRVIAKTVGKEDPQHHRLPFDLIKQVPEALASPIMVFDSESEPGRLLGAHGVEV